MRAERREKYEANITCSIKFRKFDCSIICLVYGGYKITTTRASSVSKYYLCTVMRGIFQSKCLDVEQD